MKDDDDKPGYNKGKKAPVSKGSSERKKFDQQILDQKVAEKNDNKRKAERLNKEKSYRDKNLIEQDEDDIDDIRKLVHKKGQFIQPKPVQGCSGGNQCYYNTLGVNH